ncbi:RES family NAD+ phosphorylase [Alcanivorax sp. 24]|uniref:RES family NAD+ phosphorylase n=1 Tax=Alcanivorax sp. 24 TaxID=2545266 RepID=UPI001060BDB6|nr:RES domain-containing protein [Alcanivorax sp. 24]
MSSIPAYRLVKKKWQATAFDGEGARLYGGCWNSRGRSCVYLAGSESLAILEVMVHLGDYSLLHHYALMEVRLPAKAVQTLPDKQLPDDWRDEPAPPSTANVGDSWLDANTGLALAVPSVVVPREQIYLLNPGHSAFPKTVAAATPLPFRPDARLAQ